MAHRNGLACGFTHPNPIESNQKETLDDFFAKLQFLKKLKKGKITIIRPEHCMHVK